MSTALLEQAKKLPKAEQIKLAHELWEILIESGYEPKLTPQQADELDRRIADYRRNPQKTIPWEKVKADLDRKFGQRQ